MVTRRLMVLGSAGLAMAPAIGWAAPKVGVMAPAFSAADSNGQAVSLEALRGKLVVLEWTNDGCPFVQKWYRSGAMQALQRDAAARGAVWLSVISSAPGEQGHVDGAGANRLTAERSAAPAHVLMDPTGVLGKLYGAQVTPEIYVVQKDGMLGYMGGADSIASTRVEDMARATPHAREAIMAIAEGRPAPVAVTRAYGCTVKYPAV